jgi:formylglycine-generating enzyme required for sulfatase activity
MFCKNLFLVISLALFVFISNSALAECPSADLNDDCIVDVEDFAIMSSQWLTTDSNVSEDMVYIPDGEFEMGRHVSDPCLSEDSDELPVHTVLLDAFSISTFEITNQQYCDYLNSALDSGSIYLSTNLVRGTGNTKIYCETSLSNSNSQIVYSDGVFSVRTKPESGGRDMSDDPMVEVSWYGAAAYCNWRSSEEGYQDCYNLSTWDCDFSKNGYRLPTEAEWEYAARGGNHSPYYRFGWGDTISHSQANYDANPSGHSYDVSPTSGYHPDWKSGGWYPYTAVVGSFSANGYGLYDMTGNAYEWCNDWYNSTYYSTTPYPHVNPEGPSGTNRILRGGSWASDSAYCRVADRYYDSPGTRSSSIGFRIVLSN